MADDEVGEHQVVHIEFSADIPPACGSLGQGKNCG